MNGDRPTEQASSRFVLTPAERGVVVFHLWPALPYAVRLAASLTLIGAGLAMQALSGRFLPGAALLLAATLLMCVRGYSNLVEAGCFSPSAHWDKADAGMLRELIELDRRILHWNRSCMDVTNGSGLFSMLLLVGPAVVLAIYRMQNGRRFMPWELEFLLFDAVVLLLPHWFTGLRRILRLPKLMVKAEALDHVLGHAEWIDEAPEVSLLMLGQKEARKLPSDLKLQIRPAEAPDELHGLYVQVVINEVAGESYAYVYAVLVARQGFGLHARKEPFEQPENMDREHKTQDGVEIVVIRQRTTRYSGYHTSKRQAVAIANTAWRLTKAALAEHRETAAPQAIPG